MKQEQQPFTVGLFGHLHGALYLNYNAHGGCAWELLREPKWNYSATTQECGQTTKCADLQSHNIPFNLAEHLVLLLCLHLDIVPLWRKYLQTNTNKAREFQEKYMVKFEFIAHQLKTGGPKRDKDPNVRR